MQTLNRPAAVAWMLPIASLILAGCNGRRQLAGEANGTSLAGEARVAPQLRPSPADSQNARAASPARIYDISRFAINSPFDTQYESPVPEEGKRLWATSRLWQKPPDFVVEKWLTPEPDIRGKYLLVEFWATWCRQCRLATPRLNDLHKKFRDELVVIGLSEEQEQIVRDLQEPKIDYYLAIDTQARMMKELGVFGIPHVIIVEPDGYVVWEGFPLLKGHELTEEIVERIIEAGERHRPGTGSDP
ncbi:MAG: TlpA family protein disulfide reductase [Planctomycetota bacterium]